jgi:uncharacterized protein
MVKIHIMPGYIQLLSVILLGLLLNSCGPVKDTDRFATVDPEQQAQDFLNAGDYNAAAEEFLRLAGVSKNPEQYILKATDTYIKGNRYDLAIATLEQLPVDRLSSVQRTERNILSALIALADNDTAQALKELAISIPADTPRNLLAGYYSALAQALQSDRQIISAFRARIELGQYLDSPDKLSANKHEIWNLLTSMSLPEIEQELETAGENLNSAGWLNLAMVFKTSIYNRQDLQAAIGTWTENYPGHPAQGEIIQEIFTTADQINVPPQQIALLLPFNSQYREVSMAIREGFLAAWYVSNGNKPVIRIYNSDSQNIIGTYNTAVSDGADFVVGPLEKDAITNLVSSGNITVNTLVLNQVDPDIRIGNIAATGTSVTPTLYQFGLLPEDEAYQAAEHAWFNGYANALVITPDTVWGNRIFNAFSTHWTELGGRIIEHVKIAAGIEDYAAPVKQLLNIDNSEERTKQLIATLNRKIYFEPRHRQDADLIFLATTPVIARQLVPQLRFFRADDITTYSISSIYSGIFNPAANSDVDNVIFSDMPWILDPEFEYSPLQQSLNRTWEQNESPYRRLYAFGIDAYRLIPELGRLISQHETYKGFTGNLKITAQGYINRTSVWAKFVNGTPKLVQQQ